MSNLKENNLKKEKILYLFIDESGNFDFSPKGTKYFVLTGFTTFDPNVKRGDLVKLRYRLLSEGLDQEYFHATEDKQTVRDEVYAFLATIGDTYEVHSIVARKNKTNPVLYKESYMKGSRLIERVTGLGLYKKLCENLLQYVFKGKADKVDKIVIVLGSLFVGDKKKTLLQTLKHFLKTNFVGVPFEIYSHQTCADLNCQLADYCCWAIAVKSDRGEERPYEIIKKQVKSEFDIFKNGDKEYYKYEK
jgi:RNA binding exosome subunit